MNQLISAPSGKLTGQFFTPEHVARSLVRWVVRSPEDRLLDPSCGDGNILTHHRNSFGVELDPYFAWVARERCPGSMVESTDFFSWASVTTERFECTAGNPPFVRYQSFKGTSKTSANTIMERAGVKLSGLSSTWPAFLIATALLLRPGGRMAFVVPAEIGHAPYAAALLEFLTGSFSSVRVVAVREKLFPKLSEDCWLLYADGYGGNTGTIVFSAVDTFTSCDEPPTTTATISVQEWRSVWNGRLRPFLLPEAAREIYTSTQTEPDSRRFGDFAQVGIGYITGDNDFFHLRPSQAKALGIEKQFLQPSLRNARSMPECEITGDVVSAWIERDEPVLLLRLDREKHLSPAVQRYLRSVDGIRARKAYKCRVRSSWYSVPGVVQPDYVLQYMSGRSVKLAKNTARVACTNSVHAVQIRDAEVASRVLPQWGSSFLRLSCELEGHALGGGMLKLEPREAGRLLFPGKSFSKTECEAVEDAVTLMLKWRHFR